MLMSCHNDPFAVAFKKAVDRLKEKVMPFELVENIADIKSNALEYKRITDEKDNVPVIERFNLFSYWYYFADLDLFVPNKFLGYKNSASEIYDASQGNGQNGGRARKALVPFFDEVLEGEKFNKLKAKLQKFAEKQGQNLRKDIFILEPKDRYRNMLS
jgi:hypothetical protein